MLPNIMLTCITFHPYLFSHSWLIPVGVLLDCFLFFIIRDVNFGLKFSLAESFKRV